VKSPQSQEKTYALHDIGAGRPSVLVDSTSVRARNGISNIAASPFYAAADISETPWPAHSFRGLPPFSGDDEPAARDAELVTKCDLAGSF
jgi:hypothetical protein